MFTMFCTICPEYYILQINMQHFAMRMLDHKYALSHLSSCFFGLVDIQVLFNYLSSFL